MWRAATNSKDGNQVEHDETQYCAAILAISEKIQIEIFKIRLTNLLLFSIQQTGKAKCCDSIEQLSADVELKRYHSVNDKPDGERWKRHSSKTKNVIELLMKCPNLCWGTWVRSFHALR